MAKKIKVKAKELALAKKIRGVLEAFPYVEYIYINEKGDYHFTPQDGFKKFSSAKLMEELPGEEKEPDESGEADEPDEPSEEDKGE